MRSCGIAILIIAVTSLRSVAQDSTTADGLFQMARVAAFEQKDYHRAIHLAKRALIISPEYIDIRIFLGRVFSWTKQYDSAKAVFISIVSQHPANEDAASAYIDLEYWNGNHDRALMIADTALQYNPGAEILLLKKSKVLFALKRFKESAETVRRVLNVNRHNSEARALAERLKEAFATNSIGVAYTYSYFDRQFANPWHLTSIDYSRQTSWSSWAVRVNYARRFAKWGIQYEADLYPRINKILYAYLNIGYSTDSSLFPRYRGGVSLFANLPANFESEIGMRYMQFSDGTWIYTASLAKYYESWLFGARVFLNPERDNSSQSYFLTARYYYRTADDYINLSMGTGISPDERSMNILLNTSFKQVSHRAAIAWKKSLGGLNVIGASAGWANSEYIHGKRGNQLDLGVSFQRRF